MSRRLGRSGWPVTGSAFKAFRSGAPARSRRHGAPATPDECDVADAIVRLQAKSMHEAIVPARDWTQSAASRQHPDAYPQMLIDPKVSKSRPNPIR